MNATHFTILAGLLTVLAWPVQAQQDEAPMARVVTSHAMPVNCISPVTITQVDDRQRNLSAQVFQLEPGRHRLAGMVQMNLSTCPVPRRIQRSRAEPLEAEFEAGKTYYVGFDHSSENLDEWHYVIWKVEDAATGG